MPERDKTSFIIEMSESTSNYPFNDIGFKLGTYGQILKASNFISFFKPLSAIQYVLAGIYARDNHFDSVVLLNEYGNISEAFNANIFLIQGDEVITPPLSEYCLDGVMRQHIITQLQTLGCNIKELPISKEDLMNAEEVFLSNATRGIIWVENFEIAFYGYQKTFQIHQDIFGKI
jgi:branched-chain amino acid aminotransferase